MHIFWDCPHIQAYWTDVLQCIQSITTIPLSPSVTICLLSLVDGSAPTRATCTILTLLLFYARKL